MPFQNIADEQWAYLAGIIDGEGCICIHGQKCWNRKRTKRYTYYTLFLTVGNTSYRLLKWLHDNFGGSLAPAKKKENRRQVWHWNTASKHAEDILTRVLPYLVIKKDQAELALEFRMSYAGQKPCLYRPLTEDIIQLRERLTAELSGLKKVGA